MIALSVVFAAAGVSAFAFGSLRARTARPVPWCVPHRVPIPTRPAVQVLSLSSPAWEHGHDRCLLHGIG
jgi:hypothetical protein